MSRYERYGTRSLVYSKWHRFYLGDTEPMIDLDGVEYCSERGCSKPLVLIETARDVGQKNKPTTVLRRLAESSGVLAICVLYMASAGTSEESGCACTEGRVVEGCEHGITSFRVRRVWPSPNSLWTVMTPEQFRDRLREIRMHHMAAEHSSWGTGHAVEA